MEIVSSSLLIQDEWSNLSGVMVGTGRGMGATPKVEHTYDPQSLHHVLANTYPTEMQVTKELDQLTSVLQNQGISVIRPDSIGINQVFTRDISIVIDNYVVLTNMVEDRTPEQKGLRTFLEKHAEYVLTPPSHVKMEGGDVLLMPNEIWVGYSKPADFEKYTTARTNEAAITWLQQQFPDRKVRGFELNKSDKHPAKNTLHLDCCLAPLGMGHLIYHPQSFKNQSDLDELHALYPEENRLELETTEMMQMHGNVLSIAPNKVISCEGFDKTQAQMIDWGYSIIQTDLRETSKMGGLIRCATMPFKRLNSIL